MSVHAYNQYVQTLTSVLGNRYVEERKHMTTALGVFTNPTEEEKMAVDAVRFFVRDSLPVQTSPIDIIRVLDNLTLTIPHSSAEGPRLTGMLRAINTNIEDEFRRWAQYRLDMRRFLWIASGYVYNAFTYVEDPDSLQEDDLLVRAFQSLRDLGRNTDDLPDRDQGDEFDDMETIARIRAYWRYVGSDEAALYEPLWEIITGQELRNE